MDKASFTVLETLQRMVASTEDLMGGWFYAVTVARAIGDDVEAVLDEYDLLGNEGLIDLRSAPDNARLGALARVSKHGAAVLAAARKQTRRGAASASLLPNAGSTEQIIVREISDLHTYDVFYIIRLRGPRICFGASSLAGGANNFCLDGFGCRPPRRRHLTIDR